MRVILAENYNLGRRLSLENVQKKLRNVVFFTNLEIPGERSGAYPLADLGQGPNPLGMGGGSNLL